MADQDDIFHPVLELPEKVRAARYRRLVGLDHVKSRLQKEAVLLADPDRLAKWAATHHSTDIAAIDFFTDRAPLFVFAGDVGCGKTALAESFGCELADQLDVPVYLYRLKLAARGTGLVGEMTSLIGEAFSILHAQASKARTSRGISSAYVLVVDEADALAQSREAQQMHHEDRAGVDALLAGVDGLAGAKVPVLVVLCTNRERALDPAVMRRAAATFQFDRPSPEQRHAVLVDALDGFGVSSRVLEQLVLVTGEQGNRPGYTYSDLTQRLIPTAVLTAFPDGPVSGELLLRVAQQTAPTPVFSDGK